MISALLIGGVFSLEFRSTPPTQVVSHTGNKNNRQVEYNEPTADEVRAKERGRRWVEVGSVEAGRAEPVGHEVRTYFSSTRFLIRGRRVQGEVR